ncbi:MAG: PHP-associated domain-containing protein [Methanomassiliicoccales archaeon]
MVSRADIHVHSKYSGLARLAFLRFPESVVEPEDIVRKAAAIGLDTVCITDHNTIRGALLAQKYAKHHESVSVVVGEEVSAREGEIIGLFLTQEIPKGLPAAETIDLIREQGGLVVAPHPFSNHVPALGYMVDRLPIDALEVFNAGHVDGFANHRALEHSQRGDWARLGGSDSHTLDTIGCGYTEFDGQGAEDFFRAVRTRTTRAFGQRQPVLMGVKWTMEVVLESDLQILKSMLQRSYEAKPEDVVRTKVKSLPSHKKLAALFASFFFFLPPVPYLAVLTGEWKMRELNAKPIHDHNGERPGLL